MTDFNPESTDQNSQKAEGFSDNSNTDTSTVDTKSPEHQIEVMQKRINDTQDFVKQLKEENKSLRESVDTLKTQASEGITAAELLDRMQSQQSDNTSDKTNLDVEELRKSIAADIKTSLVNEDQSRVQQSNLDKATSAAEQAFGEGWNQVVQTKLSEIGMTPDQLNELAKSNPIAATKLLGIQDKKETSLNTGGTVNSQAIKAPETTAPPANMMGGASEKTITDRLAYHRQKVMQNQT